MLFHSRAHLTSEVSCDSAHSKLQGSHFVALFDGSMEAGKGSGFHRHILYLQWSWLPGNAGSAMPRHLSSEVKMMEQFPGYVPKICRSSKKSRMNASVD
mmetsp:Transcript_25462/g.61333  ORF Transcript_25462/g.61333 Transcript_25462/m.61333 type:complete len:99 (+) Transcript_25462:2878-3174(+)